MNLELLVPQSSTHCFRRLPKFAGLIAERTPTLAPLTGEQLQLAARRSRLDQCIKLLRFPRVFSARGFERGGMFAVEEHRLAADGEQAMLGSQAFLCGWHFYAAFK